MRTEDGSERGRVPFVGLKTLWINTGTLCNLTCRNCYIESSPTNDRLVYLGADEVAAYLDEIEKGSLGTEEIGFTGGEPFMNLQLVAMLDDALSRGHRVRVLTNAMKAMRNRERALLDLHERFGPRLILRVSIDHYTAELHESERGPRTWEATIDGLRWLSEHGFRIEVAGRTPWGEGESVLRKGYARLFSEHGIRVDAHDPDALVLFPEMQPDDDVPEITEDCWERLGVLPASIMCATSRMLIRRKGEPRAKLVSCTLIPYEPSFEMGDTLSDAAREVTLNHPHCARFCVLGGASCSYFPSGNT